MSRLNVFLFVCVIVCALSVVRATYHQRLLFVELERARSQANQLRQDEAQLQYEQGALSKISRIQSIAERQFKMQPLTAVHTQYLRTSTLGLAPQAKRSAR